MQSPEEALADLEVVSSVLSLDVSGLYKFFLLTLLNSLSL
jgi:hypothetical protein